MILNPLSLRGPFKQLKQILLVDDNPMDLLIHTRLLQRMNICHQVHPVSGGEAALKYLQACLTTNTLPELMLLDIDMPLMNGFEFLEQWQRTDFSSQERVRVVLLTSSISTIDRQQGLRYNLHGYLQKPLTPEKLLALL